MLYSPAFAQGAKSGRNNHAAKRYWQPGIGASPQSMCDKAISHVRYRKQGMAFMPGMIKSSEKKYLEFTILSAAKHFLK